MGVSKRMYELGAQPDEIFAVSYAATARAAAVGAENVYNFSIGNPSVPAPDTVADVIREALEMPPTQIHSYTPAAGLLSVRKAIAESLTDRFAVECGDDPVADTDSIIATMGAMGALSMAVYGFVDPGDEVVLITPFFPEYKALIDAARGVCVAVPADPETFQIDVPAVGKAITKRTKAIIINSPNNPVGAIYTRENLEMLAQMLQAKNLELGIDINIICDEPYREITYGGEVPWVPALYNRTIVCYSYSKSLSLPGERIGWILVPPTHPEHDELMTALMAAGRGMGHTCAPSLFQRVIAACLDEPVDVAAYAKNRDALANGLAELGYTYIQPDGAFYLWVKALEDDAWAFYDRAQELNLFFMPSDVFGCEGWIRLSYCVSYETIMASMAAWKELAESYRA